MTAATDSPGGRPGSTGGELPLGRLLEAMRDGPPREAEAAWAECFARYHERVWGRVFYVMRTIPWLREPREEAADVTGQVFLALRDAARNYREQGRAEQWLLQVAMRVALRHKESVTGNWSSGRSRGTGTGGGRSYVRLDDLTHEIAGLIDQVEADERFDLRRRLQGWEADPARQKYLPFIELFLEGYAHDEIASRLGIAPGTSRTWLWQIRQLLADGLEEVVMPAGDEVSGRNREEGTAVLSLSDRLAAHPEEGVLEALVHGDAGIPGVDRAAVHLEGCPACSQVVWGQRAGHAILALGSRPARIDFGRLHARWRAGERTLPPAPERSPVRPADFEEVVGREAGGQPADRPRGEP